MTFVFNRGYISFLGFINRSENHPSLESRRVMKQPNVLCESPPRPDIRVITISSGKGRGGSERFSAALGLSGMNAAAIKLIHQQKWDRLSVQGRDKPGRGGKGWGDREEGGRGLELMGNG